MKSPLAFGSIAILVLVALLSDQCLASYVASLSTRSITIQAPSNDVSSLVANVQTDSTVSAPTLKAFVNGKEDDSFISVSDLKGLNIQIKVNGQQQNTPKATRNAGHKSTKGVKTQKTVHKPRPSSNEDSLAQQATQSVLVLALTSFSVASLSLAFNYRLSPTAISILVLLFSLSNFVTIEAESNSVDITLFILLPTGWTSDLELPFTLKIEKKTIIHFQPPSMSPTASLSESVAAQPSLTPTATPCVSNSTVCLGFNCGDMFDGCITISCGNCTVKQVCSSNICKSKGA